MAARSHIWFLLAGTALAGVALATGEVRAQQSPTPGRQGSAASGRSTSSAGAQGSDSAAASGASDTDGLLRPGLRPARDRGQVNPAPADTSETGSATRPGLRPMKTRRARPPARDPVRGAFRATLAPPGVAAPVQPIQTGVPDPVLPGLPLRKKLAIDDPYAPLGLRVGNVVFTPVVGQYLGYDTNPNRLNINKQPSALSQTELELGIQSDWSRHDLYGQLRGAYSEYFSNPAARRPEGAGALRLRLDVTRDTEIDIEGHYILDTQRPSSPDLNANVVSRPLTFTEGASIGVTQRINRLLVTIRGTIDRYDYENAKLPGGGVVDQGDRDMTQYGLRGRLGYEVHPGLIPFVETIIDTRQYDRRLDNSGYARSSDGVQVRAGALVELTRLLTAEVSAGAGQRSYEDKRLGTFTMPVGDAVLTYAMTPLTTIRGIAQATVEETAVAGARSIGTVRGTLEIQHALRRNLILTAGLRASDSLYRGVAIEEKGWGAFLRADYRLNRNLTLRASYAYDTIRSTSPGSSYVANTFMVGLRLTP